MVTALVEAIQQPAPITVRTNPAKSKLEPSVNRIPWSSNGFYLNQRPLFTADPLFHAGAYYVQEASSMFVEQVFKQYVETERSLTVLDLCAAPGGKSTLLSSLLKPNDVLLCNEVNKTRADILTENIQKWGNTNVVISRNDPSDFAALPPLFDCILVDAPCSGEGMFRKDPDSAEQWSENNVKLCAERQQRILANIWGALKPGGVLIYSTCTYNLEENEHQLIWLKEEFGANLLPVDFAAFSGISPSLVPDVPAARFFPHLINGEGLFIAAVQKDDDDSRFRGKPTRFNTETPDKKWLQNLKEVLIPGNYEFEIHRSVIYGMNATMKQFINQLAGRLYLLHAGIPIGEFKGNDLIPAPGLAFSQGLKKAAYAQIATTQTEALALLSRETPALQLTGNGWQLCTYENLGLVWVKVMQNRINNYYPKEWRIRSDYRNFEL